MAGVKNTSQAERNRRICLLRRNGFTYSQIAQMEDLSRVRVSQIVAEYNVELGDDEGRAEIASALEFAEQKCVELINQPGWKLGPDGKAARGPEGEALPDNGIVVEALKTLVVVEDKRSRLFAWDKQQQRQSIAQQAAADAARASLAALAEAKAVREAEQRRELEARVRREVLAEMGRVVPGEVVVAELPAGDGGNQQRQGEARLALPQPRTVQHRINMPVHAAPDAGEDSPVGESGRAEITGVEAHVCP